MIINAATAQQPSRLSQLVRHWLNAFNEFLGLPKWNVADNKPPTARAYAIKKNINANMPVIGGLPIPNHANMPKPRPDKTEKRITDGAGCIRFSPKYDQAILGSQKFQSQ